MPDDDPSRHDAFDPPLPESLNQCPTLLRYFARCAERLRALDAERQIELNIVHNAVTAANLRGEISDQQGVELQQLIQDRRRPHLGGA